MCCAVANYVRYTHVFSRILPITPPFSSVYSNLRGRRRSPLWTTRLSLHQKRPDRSCPNSSRIAPRSHARVRERPLQSAVGTLLLHTHYVHALARCRSPKRQLLAFRYRSSSRETVHTHFALCPAAYSCSKLQGVLGQRVLGRRLKLESSALDLTLLDLTLFDLTHLEA